jgi:hypothetical protein
VGNTDPAKKSRMLCRHIKLKKSLDTSYSHKYVRCRKVACKRTGGMNGRHMGKNSNLLRTILRPKRDNDSALLRYNKQCAEKIVYESACYYWDCVLQIGFVWVCSKEGGLIK